MFLEDFTSKDFYIPAEHIIVQAGLCWLVPVATGQSLAITLTLLLLKQSYLLNTLSP